MATTTQSPIKARPVRHLNGHKPAASKPPLVHEDGRPHTHNGVEVLEEVLLQTLPNAPFRISRLNLADGGIAFACRDCLFTEDTRGLIMEHRNQEHGARYGQKRPKIELPVDKQAPDLVLEPRADGAAPSNPLDLTIREIVALAPSFAALGDLVEKAETERDEALELLGNHRHNQAKIDGFEEMRDELTSARIQLRQQANYEEIKAEMYALRAWKKKITAKLSTLGFQLTEEDQ